MARSTHSDSATSSVNPVRDFLDEMELYGRAASTVSDYRTTLRQFERFTEERGAASLDDVDRRDCLQWIQSLRDREYAPGSIRTKAVHVNRFYGYMAQLGVFEENPMVVVMEEMSERGDSTPTRRSLGVTQMGEFIAEIQNPLRKAVVLTLVKTGMRVGELCNLDLRDVHLDHNGVQSYYGIEPRAAISDRPKTLYVDSEISIGDVVNGEERSEGNKRHRDTTIPIDQELHKALVAWLAIRPDVGDAEPLFTSISRSYGERLTSDMVRGYVRELAAERGWYAVGGGAEENVTPHYFRHFFTTEMRNRLGDAYVVKYIRGDVGDVMDRYTHNWNELVRGPYLNHVFVLK
ncbi:tyrosine-type recombinase/integrase [Halobaculum roseum]|uniref:Tyrosine-type recombinase/integrase n=1 Tax=Halobaculum roseum TaxID=2175149 RepID=A0ABD5MNP0_9EURY|nr:tyrosine-type recombinase/integrase [Halobaculum roseum]QZY03397.1 tyrosine-type recombinase/integrase [Halobaculum roseum]